MNEFDEEILLLTAKEMSVGAGPWLKAEVGIKQRTKNLWSYQDIHAAKNWALELEEKSLKISLSDYQILP